MSNAHPDRTARTTGAAPTRPVGPPSKHQLALMIWIAVFPTLTVLNLALKPWLTTMGPVLRTFVLATIAVPDRHLRTHAAAAPGPHPDPRQGAAMIITRPTQPTLDAAPATRPDRP